LRANGARREGRRAMSEAKKLPGSPGWERQTVPTGPHGWVQWKGTNVCMDVHCECGSMGHIDADFAYYVKCKACGAVYMVNGHVELVRLTDDEVPNIEPKITAHNDGDVE
jgi:hypothetical protein